MTNKAKFPQIAAAEMTNRQIMEASTEALVRRLALIADPANPFDDDNEAKAIKWELEDRAFAF